MCAVNLMIGVYMDIDILLGLQDFRNGGGSFLADFLSKMTYLGELNTVIILMALIYWAVSKDFGTYLLREKGSDPFDALKY